MTVVGHNPSKNVSVFNF